jgi:gamma-glutamyltranspeptidase/glutathione hydrolase
MMTRADGSLHAPFGVMGGFMQPQGHVQVAVAMLDDDAAPQAALDRARFCIAPVDGPGRLVLEHGFPTATAAALRAHGHDVVAGITGFERSLFGRGQIIRREPDGALTGGSDPRADGCAATT